MISGMKHQVTISSESEGKSYQSTIEFMTDEISRCNLADMKEIDQDCPSTSASENATTSIGTDSVNVNN